jgi:hypothetical protein
MTTLRIVRGGEPTDEELAALVTVLSARAAAVDAAGPRSLRQPLSSWVASGLAKGTRTKA